jgi:hypothetical protein
MRKYLLLAALLTIVLTACRVESNVALDINEDGSATVAVEIGFDEEFQQLLTQSGANPGDLIGDLPSFGDTDVAPTERVDGDMTYYGVATEVEDLSNFDTSSGLGDMFSSFSSFSYTFDDSSAELNATLTSADLGNVGGELPIDPSTITDELFSAQVTVKMPGTVNESNADEVRSDGTLVWKVSFTEETTITATSDFGSSSSSWILIILIAVLIIGLIAAIVATIVSRRESQKAVEAAAASHQGAATPDLASSAEAAATEAPKPSTAATEMSSTPPAEVVTEATVTEERTIEVTIDESADEVESTSDSEGDQPEST